MTEKLEFTEEDFMLRDPQDQDSDTLITIRHANQRANARLREMLDQAPRVYGSVEFGWWSKEPQPKHEEAHHVDTHQARLVDIRPIGKESGE